MHGQLEEYPCPCPDCDRTTFSHDEYCVACIHHDCTQTDPRCQEGDEVGGER